ncbi:trichohyalin-like isoform X1 [Nasonia vitripennis]|uniref:Trichohyalin-plectin-homology domain-containing protein n=1 Tax=Nasonia vitripennis TaxID=7425 RepID=A0A7M7IYV2_NASVI|nr:trichohyalin-like isoform X1 [Nasonia vitripennis]XP_016841588.1 trichohyalin-like isoform X1 [Nasonia vitripennis]XP_031787827.1 trichohyalin-like isoform X1 [Nasonia vitripennis]
MRGMDGDVATAGGAPASSSVALARARIGTANAPLAHKLRDVCRGRERPRTVSATAASAAAAKELEERRRQPQLKFAARLQDERRQEKRLIGESIRRRVERGMEAYEEDLESRRDRLRELLLRDEARLTRELVEAGRKLEERRATELQERAAEAAASREAVRRELLRVKELQRFAEESQEIREARQRARAEDSKRANLAQIAEAHERRRQEREDEEYWKTVLRHQCETDAALSSQQAERRAEEERRLAAELRGQMQVNSLAKRQQQQSNQLDCSENTLWKFEDEGEAETRRQAERKRIREELDRQLREARQCLERRLSEEAELERMLSSSIDDKTSRHSPEEERRDKEARRWEILADMKSMRMGCIARTIRKLKHAVEFREAVARREAEADECARRWTAEADAARHEAQRRAKEDNQRRSRELRLAWDRQHEEKCRASLQDNCEPSTEAGAATYAESEKAERARRHLAAQNYGRELLAQKDHQQVSRMQERRCLDEYYEKQRIQREREERRMAQELTTLGSRLRISGIP